MKQTRIIVLSILVLSTSCLKAQDTSSANAKLRNWLILQAIPSLSWTVFPSQTNFALEWRATPVLYSFGMTKLASVLLRRT